MTAQEAKPVLHNLQEQVHTLARVEKNRNCPKVIHTTSNITLPQPVIKKYTLQASTLFAYAKSGPGDILKKGREEVAAIAAEIARDQEQISHITVIGYTDPVGTDISNKKLSERRAQTVRSILVQNGVPMRTILAEGRGEQDLVVNDCQARYPTNKVARAECDLPNRRVEIVTYGMTTK